MEQLPLSLEVQDGGLRQGGICGVEMGLAREVKFRDGIRRTESRAPHRFLGDGLFS